MSPGLEKTSRPSAADSERWSIEATGEAVSDEAIEAIARLLVARVERREHEDVRQVAI